MIEDVVESTERAHWYYDMPMPLVADIVRTLRD